MCTWSWMTQQATATYRSGLFIVYLLGLAGTLFIKTLAEETTSSHRSSTGHVCWQFQPSLSLIVSMFRAKQRAVSRFCAVVSRSCKAKGCSKVSCKAEGCFKVLCSCFKVVQSRGLFQGSMQSRGLFQGFVQSKSSLFCFYCYFQTCLPCNLGVFCLLKFSTYEIEN